LKRVFKKNQIIITTLAVMIAIAGYLNYSGDKWTLKLGKDEQTDLSEEDLYVSGEIFTDEIDPDVSEGEIPGEAVLTSSESFSGITAQAKVNREQVRSQNKELLMEVINNVNISDEQKQSAVDAVIALTDIAERETAAEILLEAKGFPDVVVNIVDDTADVVVNAAYLDDARLAQIEDIMKRKTGVSAENIVITPVE